MIIKVRVPATSANLGAGFDCMGLALTLYNTVTVQTDQPFDIKLSGKYIAGITTDKTNLVWQTMCRLWQDTGFPVPSVALALDNNIPPARGLGSSSAAIAAGLVAANAIAGAPLNKQQILDMADSLEGHPDNVTPAIYGGVTLAIQTDQGVIPRVLAPAPHIRAVVVVPDILIKTADARSVLRPEVSRADAVFNIARVGLTVEAFLTENFTLLHEGMRDRLHQNKRASLIPGLHDTLHAAMNAGAFGAALSGSGPTLIALCSSGLEAKIGMAMLNAMSKHSVRAEIHVLDIDSSGAQIV